MGWRAKTSDKRNARSTSNIIGKQIQKGLSFYLSGFFFIPTQEQQVVDPFHGTKWQPQSKRALTLAFIRMKKVFFVDEQLNWTFNASGNVERSQILTAKKDVKTWMIIPVMQTTQAIVKIELETQACAVSRALHRYRRGDGCKPRSLWSLIYSLHSLSSTGMLDSSVSRALHRYRKSNEFESPSILVFSSGFCFTAA